MRIETKALVYLLLPETSRVKTMLTKVRGKLASK